MKFITSILALCFCLQLSAQSGNKVFKFNKEGKFKVVQFTDIHYNGGDRSKVALDMMNVVLDTEKPDLVVFSGDIVISSDEEQLWKEIASVVARKGGYYAITLGNHDAERNVSRKDIYSIIGKLPNCVNRKEPGAQEGDFVIDVLSEDGKSVEGMVYCFDSNDYNADKSYAGISRSQVAWYKKRSTELRKAHNGRALPAFAFFHVPLHEYTEAYEDQVHKPIGIKLEDCCPGKENHGMFDAIKQMGDITGVFVGHDHVNDYVAYKDGIALVYGRFSGTFNTYQDLTRGARVIEMQQGTRQFTTWLRLENNRAVKKVVFPDDLIKK